MNKVTRSEKILDRLVANQVLTPHGRDFLIAALDPMHDTQLPNLCGWPDLADQPSVVRVFKTSKTISGYDETQPWDCVVRTLPILNASAVHTCNRIQNNIYAQDTANEYPIGPVVITAYEKGQSWSLFPNTPPATWVMALPDEVASGNGRLIGMGVEVNNVTAEIYKQGTTTVWRTPQQQGRVSNWNSVLPTGNPTPYSVGSFSGRDVSWGPRNEQEAMLLSGSRQWKAADGAYCVVPFMSSDNPIEPAEYIEPMFRLDGGYDTAFLTENTQTVATTLLSPGVHPGGVIPKAALMKWAPVHSTGMAFTGLSSQSSLTITVNYYYEYFPNASDTSLVTLAKPSASYDPVALELYSEALSALPVGVPAYMNGFGDWFAGIVSKLAPTIGTLLTPLMGPGAAALGLGAKGIADSYLAANSPQSKPFLSQAKKKPNKRNRKKKASMPALPPVPPTVRPRNRRG